MEGAKSLTRWPRSSAGTRASTRSPSFSLASQCPTLHAASIASKPRKLTANHCPQINRMARSIIMKIMPVIMMCIATRMIKRMIRTKKNLRRTATTKRIWQWQLMLKKSKKKKARTSMTSYLVPSHYLMWQTTPRHILDILRPLELPPIAWWSSNS